MTAINLYLIYKLNLTIYVNVYKNTLCMQSSVLHTTWDTYWESCLHPSKRRGMLCVNSKLATCCKPTFFKLIQLWKYFWVALMFGKHCQVNDSSKTLLGVIVIDFFFCLCRIEYPNPNLRKKVPSEPLPNSYVNSWVNVDLN